MADPIKGSNFNTNVNIPLFVAQTCGELLPYLSTPLKIGETDIRGLMFSFLLETVQDGKVKIQPRHLQVIALRPNHVNETLLLVSPKPFEARAQTETQGWYWAPALEHNPDPLNFRLSDIFAEHLKKEPEGTSVYLTGGQHHTLFTCVALKLVLKPNANARATFTLTPEEIIPIKLHNAFPKAA